MNKLNEISYMLQIGKAIRMTTLIKEALDEGLSPKDILNNGILDGMAEIGKRFRRNEIFVPEVLVAARSTVIGIEALTPHLIEKNQLQKKQKKIVVGTVQYDLHDIAKNLLKTLLQGKGFEVIDLGYNVPPELFYEVADREDCFMICVAALLTTTMLGMKDIIKHIEKNGARDRFKIMVGGAPVTEDFAKSIGADYYSNDAVRAADFIEELYAELYPDDPANKAD